MECWCINEQQNIRPTESQHALLFISSIFISFCVWLNRIFIHSFFLSDFKSLAIRYASKSVIVLNYHFIDNHIEEKFANRICYHRFQNIDDSFLLQSINTIYRSLMYDVCILGFVDEFSLPRWQRTAKNNLNLAKRIYEICELLITVLNGRNKTTKFFVYI